MFNDTYSIYKHVIYLYPNAVILLTVGYDVCKGLPKKYFLHFVILQSNYNSNLFPFDITFNIQIITLSIFHSTVRYTYSQTQNSESVVYKCLFARIFIASTKRGKFSMNFSKISTQVYTTNALIAEFQSISSKFPITFANKAMNSDVINASLERLFQVFRC